MRGLLGYLSAFKGDGVEDRPRANTNVGVAFLFAALLVAVVGFKWLGSEDGDQASGNGWALGGANADASSPTTIPSSPPAVAVRIGAASFPGSDDVAAPHGSGATLPDGTPITTVPGSTTTSQPGRPRPTSPGATTTITTFVDTDPPPSTTESPTTTESPPTSEDTTTTESTTTSGVLSGQEAHGVLGGVVGLLGVTVGPFGG